MPVVKVQLRGDGYDEQFIAETSGAFWNAADDETELVFVHPVAEEDRNVRVPVGRRSRPEPREQRPDRLIRLRVVREGKRMDWIQVNTAATMLDLANVVREDDAGFVVLEYQRKCILDERWEEGDTAGFMHTLDQWGINETSIVHVKVSPTF